MKKVLITGVTGKSGQYLLSNLLEHMEELSDYSFGFVVRDKAKAFEIESLSDKFKAYVGNLSDEDFLSDIFSGGGTIQYAILPA